MTPLDIVTSVKLLHPSNADSPIVFTVLGILTLVSLVQFANPPTVVTLSGIVTLEKRHPANAFFFTVTTPFLNGQ